MPTNTNKRRNQKNSGAPRLGKSIQKKKTGPSSKKGAKKTTKFSFNKRKFIRYTILAFVSIFLIVSLIGGALVFYYASSAPKLEESKLTSTNSSIIYDKDGNEIANLGAEERVSAASSDIPQNLTNAITAIEDHRFYKHRGIDVYRIIGAAWHNLISSSTQGGSTLDQQLIKLAYFSTNVSDQTLKRKIQEAWLAIQMERKYTKEEILTFYVNKVYMGNGLYGMQTAAKGYFGKELKDLSIAQTALLAGLPQAPTSYDPYTNPDAAKTRRDDVLQQMYNYGNISKTDYDTAIATPVTDGLQPVDTSNSFEPYLDNYLKEVIEEVKTKTGADVYSAGLKIYTNIDTAAQQYLWNIYNSDEYVTYPDDQMQVASTVVDVTNGKVVAQLGTRNQDTSIQFGTNQAVLTDRDWGSTMKPITDYAPAIENEIYTSTAQSVSDTAWYWPGTSQQIYDWDRRYMGNITLQTAIAQSRNVPAVRALYAVGLNKASSFLSGLGINYPELQYSNAISSNNSSSDSQYGASSLKMAAAYAAFANGGTYYQPYYVNKITLEDGTTQTFDPTGTRAMKETTAYLMTAMMKTVLTNGTGTQAQISGVYQAGKSGTSNYTDDELAAIEQATGIYSSYVGTMAPDETFVGYTTQYAMAVWTGYKSRSTPVYGDGLYVAPWVYRAMMAYLSANGSTDFTIPDGISQSGSYYYLTGTNNYTAPTSTVSSSSSSSTSDSTSDSSSEASSSSTDAASTEDTTAASTAESTPTSDNAASTESSSQP
ncbi:penicillin-binding protein PBP1A [Streptococcus sp. DD12]|uniref:penicillin-binding protein PBP1A n=1 Tax=Streptococcus sp. DD12 TaxID=1777880 RepID=UPI00079A6627|nr:penicillin-binding protein PBP1A [Streptococcus sp. DD12]KXT75273.1 Multimodular transpeptidase-transglycosylase / Penicillin-binding protein 1A/1B (PBP1) [Streptococcus sp. DD12]